MKPRSNLYINRLTLGALLGFSSWCFAAIIPAGVQLADKQEFVRNNGSEPETLDPAMAESVPANNVTRDLFEGLTASDGAGNIVPGVAMSWRQTDANTWIFYLRKNALWSNGDPLTTKDFVYSIRRFVDPKTASPYASSFAAFLLNGEKVLSGQLPLSNLGVKALDEHTLEIKTPYPVGFLPSLVSNLQFGPVHQATVEKFGRDWTKPNNMVSNGAYTFTKWDVNSKIVVTKNPRYWDAANVQLTKVTYLPIEDGNTDVKMFESGENDMVYQLPPGTYKRYKDKYPREIHNSAMLGIRYYALMVKDPLLKDVRVRQALSMVVDRETLADKVTADGQLPAYSILVRGIKGAEARPYVWANWPMDKKVQEAKQLLVQAGVRPGNRLKFAYNTSDYHKKMAIFVASEWKKKLGIDVELEAMEFKVLIKRRNDGDFQIARDGWVADYNDATTFLTLIQCKSVQNHSQSCNPKADALIAEGNLSQDPQKRQALLTQATQIAMEDYPVIPLLQYTMPRLIKSYVGGITDTNSMDRYRGKDLYILKH